VMGGGNQSAETLRSWRGLYGAALQGCKVADREWLNDNE